MGKRAFIIIVLVAFAVCAVAVAQQRKAVDEGRFGSVEVKRTESHIMRPAGVLVIPWHVNYQGYLTDDVGNPINDTLSMTFRIYTASAGGNELWNETQNVIVEDAIFNVILGSITPIPSDVFATGESRWLELTVGIQPLFPRTEITSVAYAYRSVKTDSAEYALDTDMVDGFDASVAPTANDLFPLSYGDAQYVNEGQADAITSAMILDGEVGTSDLADGAVTSPKVLDGTILRADVDVAFKAPYADTADYALNAPADNDWVVSGNNMYSAVPGSVGIGTATPTEMLDVNGTAKMTGFNLPTGATSGYVLTSDVSGVGTWQVAAGDNDWAITGSVLHPSAPYGLAMRGSNVLYGVYDTSHVNLGIACTTGTSGQNRAYCTVSGGYGNTASYDYSSVAGGSRNMATGYHGAVSGGENNSATGQYTSIGGGRDNAATGNGATIAGGGMSSVGGGWATLGGGWANAAAGNLATVGGGEADTANAHYGAVLSGRHNIAGDQPEDTAAVVAGGWDNSAVALYSSVGGGFGNTADGSAATVAGGAFNTATDTAATVGGGGSNTASGSGATVAGGAFNTAGSPGATVSGGGYSSASSYGATVAGGGYNVASGSYATVGGGYADTVAGDYSFATGEAVTIGPAADYTLAFGRGFATSTPNAVIFENTVDPIRVGIGVTAPTNYIDVAGGAYCDGTNWTNASSREYKKEISALCPEEYQEILEKLSETEVVRFRYKTQEDDELHIGVIAEDAPEEMVDAERKGIPTGDAIGFLLAALKAQQEEIELLKKEVEALKH